MLKIFIALHHSLSHGKTSHWKWFVTWSTIASMINLTDKRCVPCEAGAKPLAMQQVKELLKQLNPPSREASDGRGGWAPGEDGRWLVKQFKFSDFAEAMNFANKITPIAEREGHHPDVHVSYGKVVVELSTHAIKGLSENDFILAAKIDTL